ncbi:MAG TPA: hypothetical protein VFB38_26055 [Chthonomonadaceae bacterium]|nr:hypothetical protein [Chthonomonadaceae bacterium]
MKRALVSLLALAALACTAWGLSRGASPPGERSARKSPRSPVAALVVPPKHPVSPDEPAAYTFYERFSP